ncbi:hypothetical protein C464_06185 [Halorubrum coriense DSM 10284]|uniref:Uncharacterized protein n=1 Tax=Halorubrum coriense DSM 10284 TaxID=1227466 RepID=M0EQ08_9EURY|nr:hypothetical protein [Halorubrum coriense]ELZ48977.1 hypothetical protein C464_06185 [Halorubrum coriense DSM 10284]QRG24130.1 hypothetical protein HrrHm1_095 [Halorubrum virus Humcor1]
MNLYTIDLPDRRTEIAPRSGGHETATTSVLNAGTFVKSNGVSSRSFDIDVRFDSDRRATWYANALEQLGNNPAIDALPFGECTHAGFDGYYIASSTSRNPIMADPAGSDLAVIDATESLTLTLERAGTRKKHEISVETAPNQPTPGSPFGNDLTGLVGIPADARRVRIVDSTSQPTQRDRPTPVATVEAEHGAVDLFDATAETIDEPTYLYDLAYELQGDVDPGVWDTYGNDSIRDADDIMSWGCVFATSHDFDGAVVIENGLLRVTIDEPDITDSTASLQAETYDATSDSWSVVGLPSYADGDIATDWTPLDVDLVRIGQSRVAVRIEFEAVAGDQAGDIYAADVQLDRGRDALFITETSDGEMPADLEALLDPIAATTVIDPGVEQGLVAREEVRR